MSDRDPDVPKSQWGRRLLIWVPVIGVGIAALGLVQPVLSWLWPQPISQSIPVSDVSVSALHANAVAAIDYEPNEEADPGQTGWKANEIAVTITFYNAGGAPALINSIEAEVLMDEQLEECLGRGGPVGVTARPRMDLDAAADSGGIAQAPMSYEVAAGAHDSIELSIGRSVGLPAVSVLKLSALVADGNADERVDIGVIAIITPLNSLGNVRARPFWLYEDKWADGRPVAPEDCSGMTRDDVSNALESAWDLLASHEASARIAQSPDFTDLLNRYRARAEAGGDVQAGPVAARSDPVAGAPVQVCGSQNIDVREDFRFGGDDGRESAVTVGHCGAEGEGEAWAQVVHVKDGRVTQSLLPRDDIPGLTSVSSANGWLDAETFELRVVPEGLRGVDWMSISYDVDGERLELTGIVCQFEFEEVGCAAE